MSLPKRKFPTLKEKLEKVVVLKEELVKAEDEVAEIVGDKKVKIKSKKSK